METIHYTQVDVSSASLLEKRYNYNNRAVFLLHFFNRLVNLEGADLSQLNLENADLSEVNLKGANLTYVNLKGANLGWTNLNGADLKWACLEGANLYMAQLRGAELKYAVFDIDTNLTNVFLGDKKSSLASLLDVYRSDADLTVVDWMQLMRKTNDALEISSTREINEYRLEIRACRQIALAY